MKRFIKSILVFSVLTLLSLVSINLVSGPKASATLPGPAWPGLFPFAMPAANFNSLYHCNEPAWNPSLWSPTFTQWISIAGQPGTTTITVPYGTASINLDYHVSAATCVQSGGSVVWANTMVTNAYTAGVSGIVGSQLPFYLGAGSPVGTYATNVKGFNYAPPGGFTSSGRYWITLGTKSINQFPANPNFRCVGAVPINTTSLSNFGPCLESGPSFPIDVTVGPQPDQPPQIAIYSECTNNRVVIQANDPNGGTLSMQYRIYRVTTSAGGWVPHPTTYTVAPNANATWYIPMGSYSSSYTWRIEARTQGRGPGNTAPTVSWVTAVTGNHAAPNNDYAACIPSCTATFNPTTVEQGGQLTPTIRITNNTPSLMNPPLRVTIRDPAGNPIAGFNNVVVGSVGSLLSTASTGNVTLSSFTASQMGTYTLSAVYNGVAATPNPCGSANTMNKPYVRMYGSDIAAGASAGCPGWTVATGNVRGFSGYADALFSTGDNTKGSGAQLGIFSLGTIDNGFPANFSSANLRGSTPTPATGLDFANTGVGTPGAFTSGSWCPYNYWGNRTGSSPPNLASLNANPNGSYQVTGSQTVGTQSIADGKKLAIYINGNLTITGNITYAGAGGWSAANQVASVVFVVNGTINIDKGVTQLDGIYVAQGANGTIRTCTNGSAAIATSNMFTQCNNQLVVNGSLVAQRIKFQRTYGSARDSASGESPQTGSRNNCANRPVAANTRTCASELINYSPEVYAIPGYNTTLHTDYVSSLPPIL